LYRVSTKIPSFAPSGERIPTSLLAHLPGGHIADSNKVEIAIEDKTGG